MKTDIIDAIQQMKYIDVNTLPRLQTRFDLAEWQKTNPLHHPSVYSLNREQLEFWGGETTIVRKQFLKKSELYQTYSSNIKESQPKNPSRRSIPHSTIDDNPEGLLEVQIRQRAYSQSGVHAKYKKRTLKQIPAAIRVAIAEMYLVQHVF